MKAREIADFMGGALTGDGEIEIVRVAALDSANAGEIAFVEKADAKITSRASCLIVPIGFQLRSFSYITVGNPKLAFARIAAILHPPKSRAAQIHVSAAIATNAG